MRARSAVTRGIQGVVVALVLAVAVVVAAPAASACACGPYAPPITSAGVGTEVQSVVLDPPTGGTAEMLDNLGNTVTSWTDPAGAGTYAYDETTTTITFTPALGFVGSPEPANRAGYRLTTSYHASDENSYTPTVTAPAPPGAPPVSGSGPHGSTPSLALSIPTGGAVTLLDGSGNPATTVVVAGQGTFSLDPGTGVVTFAPVAGFSGDTSPVGYRATDAYEQSTDGTLTVHVLAAEVTADPVAPTSTTTTTTTTTTTAARPTAATGTLPTTGSSTLPLAVGGSLLLLGGAGLVLVARRRKVR